VGDTVGDTVGETVGDTVGETAGDTVTTVGEKVGEEDAILHYSKTFYYPKAKKEAAEALAQMQKVAKKYTLREVLGQVAQSSFSDAATFDTLPTETQRGTFLQMHHISLLVANRPANVWKFPKTKKGKKPKHGVIPFKMVIDFHQKFHETQYFATLFPEKTSAKSTLDIEYPKFCKDAMASFNTAALLSTMIIKNKMTRTAEVGFACGFSGTTMAMAHATNVKANKTTSGKHYAIDPAALDKGGLQKQGYNGVGQNVIDGLGLSEYFELRTLPSHSALPKMVDEFGEESFNMIFIDGMHLFDFITLEAYYADLLLEVGGFLVFDDSQMVATQRAVAFFIRNRHYGVATSVHIDSRLTVLKKLENDDREWYYHRAF